MTVCTGSFQKILEFFTVVQFPCSFKSGSGSHIINAWSEAAQTPFNNVFAARKQKKQETLYERLYRQVLINNAFLAK